MQPKQRPVAVLVIAILHFVGGGLGLCGQISNLALQGIGGAQAFSPPPPATPPGAMARPAPPDSNKIKKDIEAVLEQDVPFYRLYSIVLPVFDVILCIMMIAAGIGLLQLQPWGRSLSLAYAALSILLKLFATVYAVLFVVPAMGKAFDKILESVPQIAPVLSAIKIGMYATPFFALAMMIYPIVVIVLLTRPNVAKAFQPNGFGE